MTPATPSLDGTFVAAFRSGTLTAAQVEAALPRDRPAVIFLLLQLSAAVADKSDSPAGTAHQPSGSIPPYSKPPAAPRRKKRGAQVGHPGAARRKLEQIDHRQTHRLPAC